MQAIDAEEIFVLSFSDSGERDPMWRLYAERGAGFSFCFPIPQTQNWPGLIMLSRCNYDPMQQGAFFDSALDRITAIYVADLAAGRAAVPNVYAERFFHHIAWFATMFKPRAYEHEHEWRIVFRRSKEHHRFDAAGRPYIEVPGPSYGPLPIEAICAGPRCDKAAHLGPLQKLARECGYGTVPFYTNDKVTT
jgi:hypothetical protein